mmetsp:Transcript_77850/g.217633  ORF Transcript_77850/g.217633 Transcript_77850/m.217633 type:complete len:334 (-) Transcript_77850:1164-2165(-)
MCAPALSAFCSSSRSRPPSRCSTSARPSMRSRSRASPADSTWSGAFVALRRPQGGAAACAARVGPSDGVAAVLLSPLPSSGAALLPGQADGALPFGGGGGGGVTAPRLGGTGRASRPGGARGTRLLDGAEVPVAGGATASWGPVPTSVPSRARNRSSRKGPGLGVGGAAGRLRGRGSLGTTPSAESTRSIAASHRVQSSRASASPASVSASSASASVRDCVPGLGGGLLDSASIEHCVPASRAPLEPCGLLRGGGGGFGSALPLPFAGSGAFPFPAPSAVRLGRYGPASAPGAGGSFGWEPPLPLLLPLAQLGSTLAASFAAAPSAAAPAHEP